MWRQAQQSTEIAGHNPLTDSCYSFCRILYTDPCYDYCRVLYDPCHH